MRSLKLMHIFMGKLTLVAAFYLGHVYTKEINKFVLNTFEGRTEIRQDCYQNIGDLEIFIEKENGRFVPKYGVDDNKVTIGKDLRPLDEYDAHDAYRMLENHITEQGRADTEKSRRLLDVIYENSSGWNDAERYRFSNRSTDISTGIMKQEYGGKILKENHKNTVEKYSSPRPMTKSDSINAIMSYLQR